MNINIKSKFGLRGINYRRLFVFLTLVLLVSSLLVGAFVSKVEGQAVVTVGAEAELKAAISNAANNVPVIVAFDKPIALTGALIIPANKDITLKSEGNAEFELFGASNVNTITVENRGTLTLAGIVVTHVSGASGAGVYVNSGGRLTLSGGKISGNTVAYNGGGVINSGNFTMTGGTVFNNNEYGVYTTGSGSNFTMTGGEITNNRYGVYLATANSFFNMTNGKISGNTGGGYTGSGTFTMTGGEISNNVRGVSNSGTFLMSGGKISDNTISNHGGGVYNSGTFTMTGGEITNNIVTGNYNGGGVYNSGTFTMLGGEISKNTATNGGGVYVNSGNVYLNGGKISGNTATRNGGGIWVTDTTTNLNRLFVHSGVVFSDNRALAAYNRDSSHDSTYSAYIENNVVWTSPFTQGYNNFDISYVYGTSITTFTVTVQDSFAEASGAGGYSVGATVTLNAGTRAGYTFYRWTVNSGGVTLSSTTGTTVTFTMPTNNVFITASWNALPSPTASGNSGGGSGSGDSSGSGSGGSGGQSNSGGNTQPTPTPIPTPVPSNNRQPDNSGDVLVPYNTDDSGQRAENNDSPKVSTAEIIGTVLVMVGFISLILVIIAKMSAYATAKINRNPIYIKEHPHDDIFFRLRAMFTLGYYAIYIEGTAVAKINVMLKRKLGNDDNKLSFQTTAFAALYTRPPRYL
jgi:uncharacterized repeat protein (TIGR02543 family)